MTASSPSFSAFCLAAPQSGGGKTTVAVALMRAFARRGLSVAPFKCGPDYVDPGFHEQACGTLSLNLDTWMMGREGVRRVWAAKTAAADIAICEGVMGLFDSRAVGDLSGSTADVASSLGIPVILVVNARGMAGSIAPLVAGFSDFAGQFPGLRVAGVIANGTGGPAHAELLRVALKQSGLPPLLGAFPRKQEWSLPERQLGLVPCRELDDFAPRLEALADAAEEYIDLDSLLALTACERPVREPFPVAVSGKSRRMAIAKDEAFCFYYEENENLLRSRGWELVPFSPLSDPSLPEGTEAVYLGGGYPEIFARRLAENASLREEIRRFAEHGEIYAECGGYMYLCRELILPDGERHPMCGVINGTSRMGTGRRSLGYREAQMIGGHPFDLQGSPVVRGHEFHWSDMELHEEYAPLYLVKNRKQEQCPGGIVRGNVRAGYLHLYWGRSDDSGALSPAARTRLSRKEQGRVLLLNGPSSAGKTTLAAALQKKLDHPAFVFSVDSLLAACPGDADSIVGAVAKTRLPLIEAFHGSIEAAARAGAWVIVDHVVGESADWVADLLHRLASLPLQPVQVTCSRNVLREREAGRTDRRPDRAHAERQCESIHLPLPGELVVDTTSVSPDECAAALLALLADNGFFPSPSKDLCNA